MYTYISNSWIVTICDINSIAFIYQLIYRLLSLFIWYLRFHFILIENNNLIREYCQVMTCIRYKIRTISLFQHQFIYTLFESIYWHLKNAINTLLSEVINNRNWYGNDMNFIFSHSAWCFSHSCSFSHMSYGVAWFMMGIFKSTLLVFECIFLFICTNHYSNQKFV